jgi:hypothetical protein
MPKITYHVYGTYKTKGDADTVAKFLRELPEHYTTKVSRKNSTQFGTYWNVYTSPRVEQHSAWWYKQHS